MFFGLQCFDFFVDGVCFFFGILDRGDRYQIMVWFVEIGEQCFVQLIFVEGNQMGCGGQNMVCRVVIVFQMDYFCIFKVVFEVQDVVDFCVVLVID